MKLLICGSRTIKNVDFDKYMPDNVDVIITGGAKGVDLAAMQYAKDKGISTVTVRPEYGIYGKAAPIRRNEKMVDMADAVLVIWDGLSKGSKYTADYAKRQNKALTVIKTDTTED